ncbi:hypothetical protein [Marinobacterium sedimentorum]|uniref:hypothetical protein n=1 Tax=Marinobacterium sedimentorum TaxID=2927804 RepID=UPI0020C71755|nr:hypothetical protein [Marinobacterium sedimentorum]MCP8685958.1 hypothetical protein [Marinobacterium sedimentorum]
MPVTECDTCGGRYEWLWEEAFDKFGFNDGDGQIETWQVEAVLTEAGYKIEVHSWGMHNTVIASIRKDGTELIPDEDSGVRFGYDCPRTYLPEDVVALLDRELP